MFSYLESLDKSITLWLNSLSNCYIDPFWVIISNRYFLYPFALVMIIFIAKYHGWKKAFVVLLAFVLCLLAEDNITNFVKQSVQRLRPHDDFWMLNNGLRVIAPPKSRYGFFSAHAACSISVAMFSLFSFKTKAPKIAMFFIAFLIGISRIMLDKHFVGDVLVGFAFGALFFTIVVGGTWKLYDLISARAGKARTQQ